MLVSIVILLHFIGQVRVESHLPPTGQGVANVYAVLWHCFQSREDSELTCLLC